MNTPLPTRIFALIGIAALVLQLNAVPFEAFLFHLNQNYIARTLCEHKVPNCNGHCFLMKQMAKSNNINSDKKTERAGAPLDGHFLCASLNNVTLFSSPVNFLIHPARHLAAGWRSTLLQPPRFA
ncbi:MAG TPA: hypothetical protein VFH95_09935 [Candidatus Kapabacteria bacterium]|nr:hypothetical protein [Candidatus Kapabacteria bacterium]